MTTKHRFIAAGSALVFAALIGGTAQGQALSKDDQKCIDQYNNKLRLVSQQAGKSARKCVKDADKGDVADPDACILADGDGKIGLKEAKVDELFAAEGKCDPVPVVIVEGNDVGNAAHRGAIEGLAHDIFGAEVDALTGDKDAAKCRDKAIQRATQAFTQKMKTFRKCKKDGMKADPATVTDEATLKSECLDPTIPDPDSKISDKVQKMVDDVTETCAGLTLSTLFPGACSGAATSAALAACIEPLIECRVCLAINAADNTDMDCDLFDDGSNNGSCANCMLDTGPATDSEIKIYTAFDPTPITYPMSGAINIDGAAGTCEVEDIAPISIPLIGYVCITAGAACPAGSRHCGPGAGPALGIDVQSDGMTGACASEAACDAACVVFCSPNAVMSSGCTGFCNAGSEPACTSDAMCLPSDGACNGPDPVTPAQANICQCSCVDSATHGASDPGDMQCNLGANLVVESGAPCDGTDVTIQVGDSCIPLTTQRATALITDAAFTPGLIVPVLPSVSDQTGTPVSCTSVDGNDPGGLVSVGGVNFFGSGIGDLSVSLKTTCR